MNLANSTLAKSFTTEGTEIDEGDGSVHACVSHGPLRGGSRASSRKRKLVRITPSLRFWFDAREHRPAWPAGRATRLFVRLFARIKGSAALLCQHLFCQHL